MVLRYYIVPADTFTVSTPTGDKPGRRPAYVPGEADSWAAMDYGMEEVFLVAADVDASQHATIAGNSPITVVPENIAQQIGGALATVQADMEQWNIPANWVTSTMTYKRVLKYVATFFQIAQRLHGKYNKKAFPSGVTLNTTVGSLTAAQRDALTDVADSFGWDHSWVTGSTTMRQLLKGLADQWSAKMVLAGVEL